MKGCVWPLPDGFPPGSRAKIKGIPTSDTTDKTFSINFVSKLPYEEGDIAYHASFRYGEKYLVNNSFEICKGFQVQERHQSLPIFPGIPFEIVVVCEAIHFSLYINGKHFSDFLHRTLFETMKCLTVVGSVKVSSVSIDKIKILSWPLLYSFQQGDRVIIKGFQGNDNWSDEFDIEFQNSTANNTLVDIPFRMTVRFKEGKTVNNTFESDAWGKEEIQNIPVRDGKEFEIAIINEDYYFKVVVNDKNYTYNLRTPYNKIMYLMIRDNIHISSVQFIPVRILPRQDDS